MMKTKYSLGLLTGFVPGLILFFTSYTKEVPLSTKEFKNDTVLRIQSQTEISNSQYLKMKNCSTWYASGPVYISTRSEILVGWLQI